jgi:hypothetical protein
MNNLEFVTAVEQYRERLLQKLAESQINQISDNLKKIRIIDEWVDDCVEENVVMNDDSSSSLISHTQGLHQGTLLSSQGPAPYVGNILDHPDLLWAEDQWTEEREKEALNVISKQGQGTLNEYWRRKFPEDAAKYWHNFYRRNENRFYKDRHYLHIVFPELANIPSTGTLRLIEVGSGVGNAIWPLLEINPSLSVIALDFAASAISILQETAQQQQPEQLRVEGYVGSIVDPLLSEHLPCYTQIIDQMDLALCMFVLSAMPSYQHRIALRHIYNFLKKHENENNSWKGKLLIRDYGRYDEAQLRFKKQSKLDENFYVRHDGTCSYFFTIEELQLLAEDIGFECEEAYYIRRQYANRQQKTVRYRVWIHMKLRVK